MAKIPSFDVPKAAKAEPRARVRVQRAAAPVKIKLAKPAAMNFSVKASAPKRMKYFNKGTK
jgi:hypothetical protein